MGAFCVYAASREVATIRAEKKVSTREGKRQLTEAEWREKVAIEASAIFTRMKPVRCSPEFDAPQFAADFIDLAEKTAADAFANMKVMRLGDKVDKKGAPSISKTTGKPMITWVPFES
jgi:hypothetical protein